MMVLSAFVARLPSLCYGVGQRGSDDEDFHSSSDTGEVSLERADYH